ncbi:hypothetical protein HY988_02630 [Candidatus Micrarchaeota archaeon]|nr:hypothetical protein [Candidatus Micrarchaeota archaeon]
MVSRASRELDQAGKELEEEKPKKRDLRQDFNAFIDTVMRTGRTYSPEQIEKFEAMAEMEKAKKEAMNVTPSKNIEKKSPIMNPPVELKPEALAWALALAEIFETSRNPKDLGSSINKWVATSDVLTNRRG